MKLNPRQQQAHDHAKQLAKDFRRLESELISALQEVDREKVYLALGFSSLFTYGVAELGLSEANSYMFIAIARKAREIPELKSEIENGNLDVSKAARIVSVITPETKTQWIHKAENLSKSQLEREVVKDKPEEVRESVRAIAEERLLLKLGITPQFLEKLNRVRVLVSNLNRNPASIEETLEATLDLYLEKKDPMIKADRALKNPQPPCPGRKTPDAEEKTEEKTGGVVKIQKRRPIPAAIKHAVYQRDQGKCCYKTGDQCCSSSHFTEIHHRTPVSSQGDNSLANLVTLCSQHHRYWHGHEKN